MNKRRTREKEIYEDQHQWQWSDRDKISKAAEVDALSRLSNAPYCSNGGSTQGTLGAFPTNWY